MKKYLYLSLLASALFLAACEISFSLPDYIPGNPGTPNNTTRQFWALDTRDLSFYTLNAQKLAEGDYCTVWVETGSGVSASVAERMARVYDTDVYPKMKAVFGLENIEYEGYQFKDTMELADALGDQDGKLCILLLDIRDGFNPNTGGGYVGGYFISINFERNTSPNYKSNERDMIYMDTSPSEPGSESSNETLAHEMQHLMNFVNTQVLRNAYTDTWLDEGLSAAAEWVYIGEQNTGHVARYNSAQPGSRINTGNNFFAWDQYNEINSNLDDYTTVYLFFQWLRLQSGGSTNIYRAISRSSSFDYNAVVGAMNNYNDWPTLLKTWLAANYINAPSGPYGYMNDSILRNVKARTVPSGTRSVNLYPGEGVYSVTNNSGGTPNPGGNIRYAGLNANSGAVNDTVVFASGALLTYNINTNWEGRTEAGTTTGVAASAAAAPESRFVGVSGPFKVSASDMLRHNGYGEMTLPPLRLNLGDKDN